MMEVTIVNTNRNSANDMIFLPNPNDLQSYYIVYSTCPPSICTNSLHERNVEHMNNCDGTK